MREQQHGHVGIYSEAPADVPSKADPNLKPTLGGERKDLGKV